MDSGINIFDEEWLDFSFHGSDDENYYHGFEVEDSFSIENSVGRVFDFDLVIASKDGIQKEYLLLTYPRSFDIGEDLHIVLRNYAIGLNSKLDKLSYINLVTICKKFKLNSIQLSGLIGELALILFFVQRGDYLIIESWHKDTQDSFDFYNHQMVLEVKSTRSLIRKHLVKFDQYRKMANAALDRKAYYVSVMIGTNFSSHGIKDLVRSIEEELSSEPLVKFREKIRFYEDLLTSEITFDIDEVLNTIKFYDVTQLPNLSFETKLIEDSSLSYNVFFDLIEDTTIDF